MFVGGAALDAVEAVGDTRGDLGIDVLEAVSSLVDKSLLEQREGPDGQARFRMLETLREYARERLEASGEADEVQRAHAAYCIVLAEEHAAAPQKHNQQAFEQFDIERDNFRAALKYLIGAKNADWALRLGLALFRYLGVARSDRRRRGVAQRDPRAGATRENTRARSRLDVSVSAPRLPRRLRACSRGRRTKASPSIASSAT